MKGLTASVILVLIASSQMLGQTKPQALVAARGETKRFIGTWRLVTIVSNGKNDPDRGAHPVGLIYYDGSGHMAVQIEPDRPRPKFVGDEPTPDEAKAALTGYGAYFGTFTVDPSAQIITHHIEGSLWPGDAGVDAPRRFEFDPNGRLVLTPIDDPNYHLTWERVQ